MNSMKTLWVFFLCAINFAVAAQEVSAPLQLIHRATYPHDANAFTQGLFFADGVLYESTGIYGRSTLRKVEIATGRVLQSVSLPAGVFAEGIALVENSGENSVENSIFLLTWESGLCLVFDRETLRETARFKYRGEGWGLTFDGTSLWMSDGSSTLLRRDPKTFAVLEKRNIINGKTPLRGINELEWVDGEIWGNVFGLLRIARINPKSGEVIGWIEMESFLPREIPRTSATTQLDRVLNGIAFDSETQRVFITGKMWSQLHVFEKK